MMALLRGITLLDLLPRPPGALSLIPSDITQQLTVLMVRDYQTVVTDEAFIHSGTVQSFADAGLPGLRGWPVEVPGLNAGVPFQLTVPRVALDTGENLEPAGDEFQLDLILDQVAITWNGLRPARRIASSGVTATHLVRDETREAVRIVGGGVMRITTVGDGPVVVRFIDLPDPLDMDAPTGALFRLNFEPPHFFIGDSDVGLTVDRLTWDNSPDYTPSEIMDRGQSESWQGIAIKEATVYLPRNAPLVGDLSAGVRDVLLGSPFGMQGELRLELGQTPVNPAMIHFFAQGSELSLPTAGTGRAFQVTLPSPAPGAAPGESRVRGHYTSPSAIANWDLPDGTLEESVATTRHFPVREGDVVRVRGLEMAEDAAPGDDPVASPEVTYTFEEGARPHAPAISVTVDSTTRANTTFLSGSAAELAGLTFAAAEEVTWQLGEGPAAETGQGLTFAPTMPTALGTHLLVIKDDQEHSRHLEILVRAEGGLLLGCEAGVFDRAGPVTVTGVVATYNLPDFHHDGSKEHAQEDATLTASVLSVPPGTLALVSVGGVSAPQTYQRRVQILMDFDSDVELSWGQHSYGGTFSTASLREWASKFPGAAFVIIGRTCDLGPAASHVAYNTTLGVKRATRGQELLGAASGQVHIRSEQVAPTGAAATTEAQIDFATDLNSGTYLIKEEHADWAGWPSASNYGPRPQYRRVDIYAVGGTPTADAPTLPDESATFAPELRRALVPGADSGTVPQPVPREITTAFRVALVVRWDSPTVVELSDAIPTLAELTVAWQPQPVPLPGSPTAESISAGGQEVLTVMLRWSYDARTKETVVTISLSSAGDPDGGLFVIPKERHPDSTTAIAPEDGNLLPTAMALGPALIAGLDAAGVDSGAARVGALVAAAGIGALWARGGKLIVYGIEVEHRQRAIDSLAGLRERVLLDYSVELGFDVDQGPIQLRTAKPFRVRYKNVGMEFDTERSGLEALALVYEDASFEIEDPGQWSIDGALGQVIRVLDTRAGAGSTWLEIDLGFSLDLGVIRLSGATIRITFDEGSVGVELRGFAASISIPGTLEGGGRLALGDGGSIGAALDLNVIPAKIAVRGVLEMDPSVGYVYIGVETIFAVGLPLANSGLGIFGFMGRFVANGARTLPSGIPDPVDREVAWYRSNALAKYGPKQGQWALGFGALVGTLPDAAFTFNAMGSLAISFPDPSLVFGIDAKFISSPTLPKEDGAAPSPGSLEILGLVAIDSTAIALGIRGSYEIPKLIKITVPINGYFPFNRSVGSYLRIGSDGHGGRTGDPVTILLLPTILDVKAWAYLMIEEKGLQNLGGDSRFSFDGFAIGFGSGWEIKWSAGPIKLNASAKILVGLGTNPLLVVGGVFVAGELDLVVVSVAARGELILKLTPASAYMYGKFCGSVRLLFVTVEGCVAVSIGNEFDPPIPDAPSPIKEVDLTERFGRVTGHAATTGSGDQVWIDTVPVIHFNQYVEPALSGSVFKATPSQIPGNLWSGTSALKYAYRVKSVTLTPTPGAGGVGSLEASWWLPTHRSGVMTSSDDTKASEQEGRSLALLSWVPYPAMRNLTEGGAGTPADPAETVSNLCDPAPAATRGCVLGQTASRQSVDTVRLIQEHQPAGPFPSLFTVNGTESFPPYSLEQLAVAAAERGIYVTPGAVRSLPAPLAIGPYAHPLTGAYELAHLDYVGTFLATLQFTGTFVADLSTGDVTLLICPKEGLGDGQPPHEEEICDEYQGLRGSIKLPMQRGFVIYENLERAYDVRAVDADGDGTPDLQFGTRGLRVNLPASVSAVTVDLSQYTGQPVRIRAFDPNGAQVDQAIAPKVRAQLFTLTVKGKPISSVIIDGGGGEGFLHRLCYTQAVRDRVAGPPKSAYDLFAKLDQRGQLPRVVGLTTAGEELDWRPDIIRKPDREMPCVVVRYYAPRPGPWSTFRIDPFMHGRVALLSACGLTEAAAQQQAADDQLRTDLTDAINDHVVSTAPIGRPLLAPGTTHQITVEYDWMGWRETDTSAAPPSSINWSSAAPAGTRKGSGSQTWKFRTAPAGTWAPAPTDFYAESLFDVRAMARYIAGFSPDESFAPHFLDDPLEVYFHVDYPQQMLEKYGRSLQLKLRRTDPPAGSLAGAAHPPDLPLSIIWGKLTSERLTLTDQRVLEAASAAPCLNSPDLGGATAQITADLEPDASYDLMLVAPLDSDPNSEEILIARCHFHTSRYRNPAEMLAALGFDAQTNPILPHDGLITTSSAPAAVAEASDLVLEQALGAMGLDPWPLPDRPRPVVLWANDGGWKLAGLMLETDEPLQRGARMAVATAQVGSHTLTLARANAPGTRLILTPPAPITVSPTDTITLRLLDRTTALQGERRLAGGPRIAYQEGL